MNDYILEFWLMKIASNFSFQHEQVRRAEPAGEAGRPQHKGRHQ